MILPWPAHRNNLHGKCISSHQRWWCDFHLPQHMCLDRASPGTSIYLLYRCCKYMQNKNSRWAQWNYPKNICSQSTTAAISFVNWWVSLGGEKRQNTNRINKLSVRILCKQWIDWTFILKVLLFKPINNCPSFSTCWWLWSSFAFFLTCNIPDWLSVVWCVLPWNYTEY